MESGVRDRVKAAVKKFHKPLADLVARDASSKCRLVNTGLSRQVSKMVKPIL